MLHLHIGRGKAGSSTIQHAVLKHEAELAAAGVHVLPSGNKVANSVGLAKSLGAGPGGMTPALERLQAALGEHPSVLVSSEFLFSVTRPDRLKDLIGDTPVQIIAYIREYQKWLPSVYAQRIRRSNWTIDFDQFYRSSRKSVTAAPSLTRWAKAFGWENIRLRALDRSDLVGGDLIADFWDAIGLPDQAPPAENSNVSLPWGVLEVFRAIRADLPEGRTLSVIDKRRLMRALPPIDAKAQYASQAQLDDLAAIYNRDIATLSKAVGRELPKAAGEHKERPFLPSIAALPPEVLTQFRKNLAKAPVSATAKGAAFKSIDRALAATSAPP